MPFLPSALAVALAAAPLLADGPRVPDYSNTPRAQVPEAFKARFEEIYPTPAAWRQDLAAVKAALPSLDLLARDWTTTPAFMADLLQLRDSLLRQLERLGTYASLQSDMDMGNSEFQAMKGEAQDLLTAFNARLTFLADARAHHYDTSLEAALFPNAIGQEVYTNLVTTLRANLAPLHRLLKLRRRMLGLKEMTYADGYASAVPAADRVFTYGEAEDLVRKATAPLGAEYARALDKALDNRWVDIYPNRGKQSGAYSTDQAYGFHPVIKLNYDGTFNSVSTLAHELGHAMHSVLADAAQPFASSAYPTFLAEVASTFNENLLVHHLLATGAPDTFKLYVLDNYLETLRTTLYRQGLLAEFERALHEQGEQGVSLAPEWLDRTYLDLTRFYYGHDLGVVRVDDWIQSEWSAIPHFYMDFYVFQYATSMAASMALAKAVLEEGAPARDRYLDLLRSGGSTFPVEALKEAGVDFTTPRPVTEALEEFDRLVGEMEALYERTARG